MKGRPQRVPAVLPAPGLPDGSTTATTVSADLVDRAFLHAGIMKFLDFRPKANAPIAVGLILHMHDPSCTLCFFRLVPGNLGGHAQSSFDGRPDLQRCRRCKVESSARNIQRFRKVIALVGGQIDGTETQRCANLEAGELASFG